jgi:hypothetical protein
MAAQRGAQFPEELSFEVTRGIRGNRVNTESVGSHWTTDPYVSRSFTQKHESFHNSAEISAEVPMSSVETDPKALRSKGVLKQGEQPWWDGGPANEAEVTVRTGAPIKIKSITTTGPKVRTKAVKQAEKDYAPTRSIDYMSDEELAAHSKAQDRLLRTRTRTYKKGKWTKA